MTPPDSTVLRSVIDAMLDAWAVIMPVECAGCGTPDRGLCASCRARLAPDLRWHRLSDGTPVVSALDYSGVARQVILAFKEHGRTDVARALAAPLRQALQAAATAAGVAEPELASVPSSWSSYRRRGFDPVALILRRAGFASSSALRHSRATLQQKTLDVESRGHNVVGSLRPVRPLHGRQFILVDDVITTGATLAEAARAIREGGGAVICAATVAHTDRLFPADSSSS
ncbi:MAG TPA: phosphoribosyltransferase family protein [Homoserinimonas sp.]|nr:phosphoribosyltransferase family protein [Homoserinimonas sp.]